MRFRVHIAVDENREFDADVPTSKRLTSKELTFTCGREEAEEVFKAACDAAVKAREKRNGEEEKVD